MLQFSVLAAAIAPFAVTQTAGSNAAVGKSGLRLDGQPRAAVPTSAVHFGAVDAVIQSAISDGSTPGAVLVVGHDGQVIYRKAYGLRALEPRREVMTLDTVFDLASLTKVIVTSTAVMQLVERGKVRLNDPVTKYLPEFAQNGKEDITVRQLVDALLGTGAGSGFEDGVGREGDGLPDGVCGDSRGYAGVEVFL